MTATANLDFAQFYGDWLTLGNDNTPGAGLMPEGTLKNVQDGNGIDTPMQISTNAVNFSTVGGNRFKLDSIALTATATRLNSIALDAPSFSFSTGSLTLPSGTTGQEPSAATDAQIRFNLTTDSLDFSFAGVWHKIPFFLTLTPIDSVFNLTNLPDFSYSTSSMKIPTGTTGQQPAGSIGEIRYDSTTNQFKGYTNLGWRTFTVS